MSALPIIITSAGLAALVNAANTGTEAVVIAQIGVSATAFAPTVATAAIPGEIKRLATIAGVVVADDTIHVAVSDTSADAYTLRTIGLYLDTGVLFAVYSSATSIAEKAAPATLLLSSDIKLTSPLAGSIEFGDSSFTNPPGSETVLGVLRLASEAEAIAGVNGTRAITPSTMKATILSHLTAYAATVTAALSGKAAVGHVHAASDTTSGTFDVARIPDLAVAKITGLVAMLAGKANSAHTHLMADVTGLTAALGLKLDVATFTWGTLPGRPNVAIIGSDTGFNSLQLVQASNPVIGRIYLGNQAGGVRQLLYDGAQYQLPGAQLLINGAFAWHANNFNPADKAATVHTHAIAEVTGLTGELAGKAAVLHTHAMADVTGLVAALAGKAAVSHTHVVADVGGLAAELAAKAALTHVHAWTEITGREATAAEFRGNAGSKALTPSNVWSAAALVAAAQAATIAVDLSGGLNFSTTMTGNRTLGAPSNAKPGQSGVIQLIQDATGNRTLAFDPAWKFEGGVVPELSRSPAMRDVLVFTVIASGDVVASLLKDVRR